MNRSSLLHIVERLEGFLGKLPETIRKPILHELTPLKELFLQQRPPRFALAGSDKPSVQQIIKTVFAEGDSVIVDAPTEDHRWQDVHLGDRGTISILDLREAKPDNIDMRQDLKSQSPDIVFFV